jgi:hypothetical protein
MTARRCIPSRSSRCSRRHRPERGLRRESWFPTTIIHARGIPAAARFSRSPPDITSRQPGESDPDRSARGRQEAEGVTLVAPVRPTKSVTVDAYGQEGDLFAYPYPIDERTLW